MPKLARKPSLFPFLCSVILGVLLATATSPSTADLYCYEDAQGVLHFTYSARRAAAHRKFRRPPSQRSVRYDSLIREFANRYDVEPALIKAVIHAESDFDQSAVSRRGARGLMQLMPRTARAYGRGDLHEPRHNIECGVRHLRNLLERFQSDTRLAVAAYNAGTTNVLRYGGLPPFRETRSYVARVMRFRDQYRREATIAALSPTAGMEEG